LELRSRYGQLFPLLAGKLFLTMPEVIGSLIYLVAVADLAYFSNRSSRLRRNFPVVLDSRLFLAMSEINSQANLLISCYHRFPTRFLAPFDLLFFCRIFTGTLFSGNARNKSPAHLLYVAFHYGRLPLRSLAVVLRSVEFVTSFTST
jgi:hypothetical protein